jgi:class 3 adenylate cyclase
MSNLALTELLASYVPRLIQNRVIADPAPIEAPVAEEFQAAILFADISGFTLLTERMAQMGPTGVEILARILNEYFGQLIDIIHSYGGDVVKFAGDAVIAVWPIVSDLPFEATSSLAPDSVSRADQWQWTMRAAECALEVHKRLTNYQVENANLYLKLAVSMGRIDTAHVGGVFNRWEFLMTGTPLVELGIANNIAKAGEILITPSAWKLIRKDCTAEPMEFELRDTIAQGGRLGSLNKPSSIFSQLKKLVVPEGAENSLRPYIPGAVINRLTAGQGSWIAELRRVTVLFINLPDLDQHTELERQRHHHRRGAGSAALLSRRRSGARGAGGFDDPQGADESQHPQPYWDHHRPYFLRIDRQRRPARVHDHWQRRESLGAADGRRQPSGCADREVRHPDPVRPPHV